MWSWQFDLSAPKVVPFGLWAACLIVVLTIAAGLGSTVKPKDCSSRYSTLLTPEDGAFNIWPVIYTTQGVVLLANLAWDPEWYSGGGPVTWANPWAASAVQVLGVAWASSWANCNDHGIRAGSAFLWLVWAVLLVMSVTQQRRMEMLIAAGKPKLAAYQFISMMPWGLELGWVTAAAAVNTLIWVGLDSTNERQVAAAAVTLVAFIASVTTARAVVGVDLAVGLGGIWGLAWISARPHDAMSLVPGNHTLAFYNATQAAVSTAAETTTIAAGCVIGAAWLVKILTLASVRKIPDALIIV